MKFLIHGNAPDIPTGYGVQCRYLVEWLADRGHEVAVSSTYGYQGRVRNWRSPNGHDIRVYPNGAYENGPDIICAHAEHWFDGDPTAGWIIPITDVWVLNAVTKLRDFQVAAWAPVDHLPLPKDVQRFFEATGAHPIAMSKFGRDMMIQGGLQPSYVPLSVDTTVYKPTFTLETGGTRVSARDLFRIPRDAFVVGMVAMNKGNVKDRKGFNEAFRAFGAFHQMHPEARLFLHTDRTPLSQGIDLDELAVHAAIPPHAIIYTDQYAYRLGLPPDMMAAAYTSMDVLLAPSHGEGFCVPLIEAQACGTPVIASDFSAQPELIGAGWLVSGQLEWDPAQHASYITPFTHEVLQRLVEAYDALNEDDEGLSTKAIEFAAQYDTARVLDEHMTKVLDVLLPPPPVVKDRMESVDVLVPALREENRDRLLKSFKGCNVLIGEEGTPTRTYAENVNALVEQSTADWVLIVGDDCEALPGWFEAAQAISERFDVIGTNDSEPGRVRNPDVAAGRHADHFFIRRQYIDDEGACLNGPGVCMPEEYGHWYTDREVIELAKARGVFGFAEECRIVHHHPGFDGNEAAREADPVYMKAVASEVVDRKTWMMRAPLIEAHRVTIGRAA